VGALAINSAVVLPAVDGLRAALPVPLPAGGLALLRQVAPEDGDGLQAYFRGLSPRSRNDRLGGAGSELPAGELQRTLMQGARGGAWLVEAMVEGHRAVIGEARSHFHPASASLEIALSVHDAWQRLGIGSALLAEAQARAIALDAECLVADVLRDNDRSRAFLQHHGFTIAAHGGDWRSLRLARRLSARVGDRHVYATESLALQ
jgi:GNAT superfamily N-acetyltransferase